MFLKHLHTFFTIITNKHCILLVLKLYANFKKEKTMAGREDLIKGLSQAMNGNKEDELCRQFFADTNTLKTGAAGGNVEVSVLVSKEEFARIASGVVKYHITDRRGIEEGNDMIFNEVEADGFTQTGHKLVKRVINVQSYLQIKGLKDNYSIVSF
jgi:hypothetical protein